MKLANRRKGKVTCEAIKKNGERCKQTVGLVDGFCPSHRIAKPVGGEDEFKNILDEVLSGTPTDGTTAFDIINGVAAEVPVDEPKDDAGLGHVEKTGDVVHPEEVFEKYSHLMKHVSMDAVANKDLFAAYVIKVSAMSYLQCGLEFKFLKSEEDELSAKSKKISEEAHQEYGQHIPLDIRMEIEAIIAEVTEYKSKRAVVLAAIEHHESQMEDEPEAPVDNKPAFEDVVKAFIVGLVAKAKGLMKGVTPRTIIIVGALMSLVAVASMVNMGDAPAPTPKSHNTVVEHNTKATVDVQPAVDVEPADNVVARVDGHNGAVHADEIYTVKSGDTLWDIAVAKYHDGTKWTLIYNANKDKLTHDDVRNVTDAGHWIHAGQSLFVPGGAS